MVLRTSIIGEEIHKNASLIEWAKSMKGQTVKGFTNHMWNGITTTQYADICTQIIENNLYQRGLFHVFSDSVNKYELISAISDSLSLDLHIEAHEPLVPCNRTLKTAKDLMSSLTIPSIKQQLLSL